MQWQSWTFCLASRREICSFGVTFPLDRGKMDCSSQRGKNQYVTKQLMLEDPYQHPHREQTTGLLGRERGPERKTVRWQEGGGDLTWQRPHPDDYPFLQCKTTYTPVQLSSIDRGRCLLQTSINRCILRTLYETNSLNLTKAPSGWLSLVAMHNVYTFAAMSRGWCLLQTSRNLQTIITYFWNLLSLAIRSSWTEFLLN